MQILAQLSQDPHLDFWTEIGLNLPVHIMMTPFRKSQTLAKLRSHGMVAFEMVDNVQDLIDEERDSKPVRKEPFKMTWDDYYTYDEVSMYLQKHTYVPFFYVFLLDRFCNLWKTLQQHLTMQKRKS